MGKALLSRTSMKADVLRVAAACALACALALTGCAQPASPVTAQKSQGTSDATASWQPAAGELERLDDDGYLYYLDYTKDYYSQDILRELDESGATGPSCSAFFTHTLDGEPLTCRNFDEPHRVSAEDRTITGLNVVLHCAPAGKYESIGVADAVYCGMDNPLLKRGGPDAEGFSSDLVDTIPYQTMDAMNEKGLSVSVLMVDIKEGEEPSRMVAGSSIILRRLVDNCASVDEAADYVRSADITAADWQSCHLFVTDADGRSAVIESRNGELSVVETDVVTNFYVGSDDIADSYLRGRLREEAVRLVDENGEQRYRFGYGHGYHRFVTLASQLEMHRDTTADSYRTRMSEAEALVMLQSVAQNEWTEAAGTSFTQFSSMYRNAARTLTVWSFQRWQTSYTFDVHGQRS